MEETEEEEARVRNAKNEIQTEGNLKKKKRERKQEENSTCRCNEFTKFFT